MYGAANVAPTTTLDGLLGGLECESWSAFVITEHAANDI
jgi:hypothetical protein